MKRLSGHSFLEVLVSLGLFGLFTVIILELSLASRLGADRVEPVVAEWVSQKWSEIKGGDARYRVSNPEERLLVTEERENGELRVYGQRQSRFLSRYRIDVDYTDAKGRQEKTSIPCAHLALNSP